MNIPHFGLTRQYQNLKEETLDITDKVLTSGILVNGEYTNKFEEWLKHRTKARYAIITHSGTQALYTIAKYKYDIEFKYRINSKKSPTVILPNLTYPATLNAFALAGWNIVIEDTDKYGVLDKITISYNEFPYICLVGLYGKKPWPNGLIYEEHQYYGIVDGAQHWLNVRGDFGSAMAISFDPTKNLSANGNGGAIVTDDDDLNIYARDFINNGKNGIFNRVGTNSKMSELDCAHLMVKTRYINAWQKRRHEIARYYNERFKELPITLLADDLTDHALQKYVIYSSDRSELCRHMKDEGIDVKIHYNYTLSELGSAQLYKKPDMLSTSTMLSRGVLSLPIYPELTDIEVEYIVNMINKFYT